MKSPETERHVDRREFLKLAGLIAVATAIITPTVDVIGAHTGSRSLTIDFWEHLETGTLFQDTETLQRSIENTFGVVILPGERPEETAEKFNIDVEMVKKTMVLRLNWDGPRLWAIHSTLAILPEHFYSPQILGEEQRPLKFSLYEYYTPSGGAGQYWAIEHDLQLVKAYYRQTLFEQLPSKKMVVHELTHSITSSIFAGSTRATFVDSERKLKDLVQLQTIDELRQAFVSLVTEDDDPDLKPLRLKSWRTHIGYGASNFSEFWSVAAEYYIDGKDSFIREYAPYLSLERAASFYRGLKEELFRDREYKAGVLITNS